MSLSSTLTLFGKKRLYFRHFLKRLHNPAAKLSSHSPTALRFMLTALYVQQPPRSLSDVTAVAIMDTFFRRHFKRKDAALQEDASKSCRQRRPSVAVPTSKARRRSTVGMPSSALAQRRRSSVQPPSGSLCAGGGRLAKTDSGSRWAGHARRRSSTTTPNLNPRFAVRRRKVGKLRTIDTHLLGPSMLLASLIQMAEEDEEEEGVGPLAEQQVEVISGVNNRRRFSRASSLFSDGDDNSSRFSTTDDSQSETSQLSEAEQLAEEEENTCSPDPHFSRASSPSVSSTATLELMKKTPPLPSPSRPLIRAPRCLRRNSSQVFTVDSIPYGCCRTSSQRKRRRISAISKAGSPWPGRGPPLPSRKTSVYYLNHPGVYRGAGALSPLGPRGHDSCLESWSAFLLYVTRLSRARSFLTGAVDNRNKYQQ